MNLPEYIADNIAISSDDSDKDNFPEENSDEKNEV